MEEHLTNALDVSGRAAQMVPARNRARIAYGEVVPLHRSTKK